MASLAVLGGLVLYVVAPNVGPTTEAPTPTAPATPSMIVSPTVASSPSSSPSLPALISAIDLKAHVVSVPRDFRYVTTASTLLVLDLAGNNASEIASFTVPQPEPGFPIAEVAAAQDGKSVLLTIHAGQRDGTAFVLTPGNGQTRVLIRGAVARVAFSPDGSRFAVARNDQDPALTGLWVGVTAGGSMRRLIADDPQYAGSPPVPYGFSPSSELLAFGLFNGESGAHAGIVSVSSTEGSADHSAGTWAIRGSDAVLLGPSAGAEFISDDELFVWSSRNAFGGQTLADTYEIAAKTRKDLYRAEGGDLTIANAAWAPGARSFALAERPICCGAALALTVRTIAEDGSMRKLGEWSVIDMWWSGSGNGAKLYGVLGLDDSTGTVVDMLLNKTVMRFCWRGGSPGAVPSQRRATSPPQARSKGPTRQLRYRRRSPGTRGCSPGRP